MEKNIETATQASDDVTELVPVGENPITVEHEIDKKAKEKEREIAQTQEKDEREREEAEILKIKEMIGGNNFDYPEFMNFEQQIFVSEKLTSEEYSSEIFKKFGSIDNWSQEAIWLFSHHRAEILAVEGRFHEALKDITVAYNNNIFDNQVTVGLLYFLSGDLDSYNSHLEKLEEIKSDEKNSLIFQIEDIKKQAGTPPKT